MSNGSLCKIPLAEIKQGISIIDLLTNNLKVVRSRAEARRICFSGGIKVNGTKVTDITDEVRLSDFNKGLAVVQVGRHVFDLEIEDNDC